MSKGTPRRTVRIDDELWEDAQLVAKQRDEDLSDIIRQALRRYINTYGEENDQ